MKAMRPFLAPAARTFHELRKVVGTSKIIIPVPLFHLKFLDGICRLRGRNFKWAALLLAAAVMLAGDASAQVSLAPPAAAPDKPAVPQAKPVPAAKPKVRPLAKKPTASPSPQPAATATPAGAPDDPNVDLVYGAYQRGLYKTTFDLAIKRAQEKGDPKAMTMLGELYANAFGVKRDDAKAAEWYKDRKSVV